MSIPRTTNLVSQLVAQELGAVGHCYFFGGVPGHGGGNCWDCSSMQNWMFGVFAGLSIPGYGPGQYNGSVHGPSTLGWLAAQGQMVGSVPRSVCAAGDLCVWPTHMGMAISNSEMVSAANATDGTIRSGIDGFIPGEPLTILRHNAMGGGGVSFPIPSIGNGHQFDLMAKAVAEGAIRDVATRGAVQRVARIGWPH